ncbi:MAG: hypothetical protein ACJA1H_000461 [Glaciecola sp.]|jgi:hypothetical protein
MKRITDLITTFMPRDNPKLSVKQILGKEDTT